MIENRKYINNPEYERHKLKYGTPVPIRFNQEQTDMLNDWCEKADISSFSEGVKVLMQIGYNVLHGQSSAEQLYRLFKKDRARRP